MNMKGVLHISFLMLAATLLVLPVSGTFAVTGIDPDQGINTGPVFITNLAGTGFQPGAAVVLSKTDQSEIPGKLVIVESSSKIVCNFDLTNADPGIWSVQVTNPDEETAILPASFTVFYPPPSVMGISPSSGRRGEVISAEINGGNFLSGCTVSLLMKSGENIPVSVTEATSAKITCNIDLTGETTGLSSLTITNPDGQEVILRDAFLIVHPAPTVGSITPDSGENNGMTGILTLTGTGFLSGATVRLTKDGQPDIIAKGTPAVENETTMLCFFDLAGARVGSWNVEVTNTDGQSGTLPAAFTVSYPTPPEVTGVTPNIGINNGIVVITDLAGTGFEDGATVSLRKSGKTDIPATNVVVSAPDRITCDVDLAGAETGEWDIIVINDDGQYGVFPTGFMIQYLSPVVSVITPAGGFNNGSVIITNLSGTGFRPDASVKISKFGHYDIGATAVTVVNSDQISCILDLTGAATGWWDVIVSNPDNQYGILPDSFMVENPNPTIETITPSKGPNNGPVFISAITGTTFLPDASVQLTRFGQPPITATGVTIENMTRLNCTFDLTDKETGKWNVVIQNTDGKSGILISGFEVTASPPVPDFSADPVYGTAPLTVHFKDLSTKNPVLWAWNFGDGTTSVGYDKKDPIHTYHNPGNYSVLLQVSNKGGTAKITKQSYIKVVRIPVAKFTAEPMSGAAPLLVRFTDKSDGHPSNWFWDFGDGGKSQQQNPYNLYKNPGKYTVILTVKNNAGSDTVSMTDLITVNAIPDADFMANQTNGISPLSVQFTDLSMGSPASWLWTFGDGGTSKDSNPVHVFSSPGTYSVRLDVANVAGKSTETKGGYITVHQSLKADFEYKPSNPDNTAPLTVAFTDRSIGSPRKWYWSFGDGYVDNQRNPIHNFANPGVYNVTLTVNDLSGNDSVTKTLTVKSPLRAEFYAEPTTGSAPLTVVFSDTSIGVPIQRYWVISKGTDITLLHPGEQKQVYTFNEPGLYSVMLHVQDAFGSISELEKEDYINVLPF